MTNQTIHQQIKKIEDLIDFFEKLQEYFKVSETEIFDALYLRLYHKHNFEWVGDVWNVDLSFEDAVHILQDFDFSILRNVVETDISLLPADVRITRKARFKYKGDIWVIHKYDQDPFPSSPHAHNIDNGIKLDLTDGKCYKVRMHVYTINRKELIEIRKLALQVFKGDLPMLALE